MGAAQSPPEHASKLSRTAHSRLARRSHAQFYQDDRIPEVKEAFEEIGQFFDRHLGQAR